MAAKIFAIANQKGGVGKTTTAVNLAAGLARRRIRTVLVDMDQQASATSALGYEKSLGGSLYQVLHGEGSARDKLIQTQRQNLWLIPSETDMVRNRGRAVWRGKLPRAPSRLPETFKGKRRL